MAKRRKLLGQILKEIELVTEGDIQEALARQKKEGNLLGKILVAIGVCSEGDITMALAAQNDMQFVDLSGLDIPIELLDMVTEAQAQTYRVVPLEFDADNKTFTVAMDDPTKIVVFDELQFALASRVPGIRIQGALASSEDIDAALAKFYGGESAMAGGLDKNDLAQFEEGGTGKKDALAVDDDPDAPAVVKLLNFLLATAIRDRSSDIHLEPFEDKLQVRYRVDGALLAMENPPQQLGPALVSRIKVLSKLNISETRMPQDGRIELTIEGRSVDLRVSTLPTMFGESCVMRILDRSNVSLDLDNLGMRPDDNEMMKALIAKPNGVVLVTGPTGSGKTTTLYSCLNYMNRPDLKIITTEDPVEYDLPGVMQCQVNEDVGLTYGAALRSILRQDPDMILVGEIRDKETGGIAIEAALTGHLVLSTLHTNDAPSAVTRMLDLGLESFLIAATLEAVIAQRLVRKICQGCKEYYVPEPEQAMELGLRPESISGKKFGYGRGCSRCNNTGYKGRLALYEMFRCNDEIKQMIMDDANVAQLRDAGRRHGMRTLRESGLLAIYDCITTIEEVMRETLVSE
ncbi:MAG: Flp pilus assembly complex ATPase component TadA [Planctomycetes bacterium]|jgi:type IV pilus assembly protein PilB|nr:Flp pilus assembly complex ATPase component TadA [Planctomycetota bacterium]MCL4730734.1 Flp pilus assembly complex ATPase component TadA [Planctomycetota bacterium]